MNTFFLSGLIVLRTKMLAFLFIKIFSQDVFYSVHFKRKRGATVPSQKETPVPYRSIPLATVAYHPFSPFAVHHWTVLLP
jgi:hypothetical protein